MQLKTEVLPTRVQNLVKSPNMKVYFDNAATTSLDKEVLETMRPLLEEHFGNPSSIHSYGRKTRAIIEGARKTVAKSLNVSPSEIFFTSGGTEANNIAIQCGIYDLHIKHAITSKIEHHAVLHPLEVLEQRGAIKLNYVNLTPNGHVDLDHLEELLKKNERSFVSLMHANNEIGNLLPLKETGEICVRYNAVFHSDTVQTMGHYRLDLQAVNLHFATCAPHKFHGPKGVGFLYVNNNIKINPLIFGGSQERNMRAGTENVYGIAGLAKALEIAERDLEVTQSQIREIRSYMINQLQEHIKGVTFHGDYNNSCLYTVLNVCFPPTENAEMLLFNLDIAGIAASGGSACTSGSMKGSHVLQNISPYPERPSIRFSFSKHNKKEEVDYCVAKLSELFAING